MRAANFLRDSHELSLRTCFSLPSWTFPAAQNLAKIINFLGMHMEADRVVASWLVVGYIFGRRFFTAAPIIG